MTIEMPDLFVHCIKFILSGAIGAAIIVIINHFYKRYEYNCSLKNDIYALLCNFFFIASIQSSELANHKMQLVEKLKKLKSLDASCPGKLILPVDDRILYGMLNSIEKEIYFTISLLFTFI